VTLFSTSPHNHTQILNTAPDTVAAAIEEVARGASWKLADHGCGP
jgi:hypothetical protein